MANSKSSSMNASLPLVSRSNAIGASVELSLLGQFDFSSPSASCSSRRFTPTRVRLSQWFTGLRRPRSAITVAGRRWPAIFCDSAREWSKLRVERERELG
ncbi:hypothetical protein Dimus_031581 [Dionaea muscipula]